MAQVDAVWVLSESRLAFLIAYRRQPAEPVNCPKLRKHRALLDWEYRLNDILEAIAKANKLAAVGFERNISELRTLP